MLVLSTIRLPRVKIPPTSQYAPMKVIIRRVVIPGVMRNIIPIIRDSNPHRSTSHHGKRLVQQIIPSDRSVVSVIVFHIF
jgi:hypothetical protein